MSEIKMRIKFVIMAVAILAASVILPFENASATSNGIAGAGEERMKNFLLAYGLYKCFDGETDDTMNQNLILGNPFKTVLKNSAVKTVNLGPWLNKQLSDDGKATSKVTCDTIFDNVLGSDKTVTIDLITNEDGILNGAYQQEMGIGYTLACAYKIWHYMALDEGFEDDSYSSYNDDRERPITYVYSQGYRLFMQRDEMYDDDEYYGDRVVPRTSPKYKIQIYHDDTGAMLKSEYSDIHVVMDENDYSLGYLAKYVKDEYNKYVTSDSSAWDSQFRTLCAQMIKDGDTYDHYPNDAQGPTGLFLKEESFEMDPYGNIIWGKHRLGIDIDGTLQTVRAQAPATGKLLYVPGAASVIADNIKTLYFNSETPEQFLNNNPDIAYVYYGRILFNGDGKYEDGCGGISVAADDPKINELNLEAEWNIANGNVLNTEAYDASGNKKSFVTKFSTDASKSKIKTVGGLPWETDTVKCDVLVGRLKDSMGFNGHATAKSDVYGYISPKTAESLITGGTGENPPSTGEDPPSTGEEPSTTEAEQTEYNCYTNAASLGWIVCPIIDSLKDFIQEKYAQWIAPALKVDVELFQWGDEDSTYYAWNIFRNIANILFVIFFVIIIFSQITGYGIDSYGVKKAFPKLLIGAVLINLSFIICQVAIDLGNIAGAGIGGLFQSITKSLPELSSSITVDGVDVTSDAWDSFVGGGWTTAIIVIVGLISVAAVLAKGLAIVIPVVMAMISIAISIFALIAILGIRQAAAVLLVVASPIAFACYILPNTKTIFQKWFKAFQGLLLAYPVCSALVYGGDMVSHILIRTASGNMWVIIAAAVVSIAPIFFIPKVISNCMGAISMGMVAFANRGKNKAKGAVGKRLDNSFLTKKQKYKQQMRNQKAAARSGAYAAKRGQRIIDKYKGHEGELRAGQRRKYNAAQAAVNAQKAESENAYSSTFEGLDEGAKKQKILEAAGFQFDKNGQMLKGKDGKALIDPNKKLDGDMLTAGLRSMKNSAEMGEVFKQVSGTDAFKDMMKGDEGMRQRLAGVMMGSEGNAINQSIGQLMAEGKTPISDILANKDGILADRVSGMGAGVMASQKAEVFKMEGAANLFSDDQLREAAASGYTGDHQENFFNMMQNVSTGRKEKIVHGMNAQQVGRLRVSNVNGVDHGSLGAVGGAALVKNQAKSALNIIRSADGNNIRVAQQGAAAEALETAS